MHTDVSSDFYRVLYGGNEIFVQCIDTLRKMGFQCVHTLCEPFYVLIIRIDALGIRINLFRQSLFYALHVFEEDGISDVLWLLCHTLAW